MPTRTCYVQSFQWALGMAEMDLQDGAKKQPDFSFVDNNSDLLPEENTFPTTIFEVAYSEALRKLSVDCSRFIACSVGRGLLAIGIDIKNDSDNRLKTVRCSKWELVSIDLIKAWPPTDGVYGGQQLDTLYRSDAHAKDEAGDLVCPPATSFYCISQVGSEENQAIYAFHAKQVESFLVGYNLVE